MSQHIDIIPRTLHFKQPAGTSRGVYTERKVWYLRMSDGDVREGWGECAPLPNLSCDYAPSTYEEILRQMVKLTEETGTIDYEKLRPYPSILFGLETMFWHWQSGSVALSKTDFSNGKRGIQINGLIWMGSYEEMAQRIEEKLQLGFRCIKLKIGAIDFENELALLRRIRRDYPRQQVELRVDANGAFAPERAGEVLRQLSELDLHSIEQPIRAGQWEAMSELCASTPLPIALDEELIGVNSVSEKVALLDKIKPQYIILKPSLHGGISGAEEWIGLAEERGIGWWVTSALESNVGLNAIAHWCARLLEGMPADKVMPQGLGTGQLFTDNVRYPLCIKGDALWFDEASV